MPLTNPDGSIVGMVFAGQPSEEVDEFITSKVVAVSEIAVLCTVIISIICILISRRIVKVVLGIEDMINELSEGNITYEMNAGLLRRKDEFGHSAKAMAKLQDELKRIIGHIKISAGEVLKDGDELESIAVQTSATADEVGSAVESISKGAQSQAEDTETAMTHINQMGKLIQDIVDNVAKLNETSLVMQTTGDISATFRNIHIGSEGTVIRPFHPEHTVITVTGSQTGKVIHIHKIPHRPFEERKFLPQNIPSACGKGA